MSILSSPIDNDNQPKRLKFRYVWPVKVSLKKLNPSPSEVTLLNISPKFVTVYDHVAFQWTIKLHTSKNLDHDDEESLNKEYLAVSIYYLDGPVSSPELNAKVSVGASNSLEDQEIVQEKIQAFRGHEVELVSSSELFEYVMSNMNKRIRLSITLDMDGDFFKTETYLNSVSPTPFRSFLTENYRARCCSNVWKKRAQTSFKRPRSHSEGQPNCKKIDLERAFNRIMEMEMEYINNEDTIEETTGKKPEHPFKKLLVYCCDSCSERRASIIPCASENNLEEVESDEYRSDTPIQEESKDENICEKNTFECCQEDKAEIHDILANMYFNKIALPQMEYVGDFEDFLIDAELNELPVLKRSCERYLCGELNTKRDIQTCLLLNLLFLSMGYDLPIMKSMLLTELCDRSEELNNIDRMLEQEEYKKLNDRICLSGNHTIHDLIDECKRFREQRVRVQQIF